MLLNVLRGQLGRMCLIIANTTYQNEVANYFQAHICNMYTSQDHITLYDQHLYNISTPLHKLFNDEIVLK